jgi:LytR cell envelope-related transcriptional attenuator
VDHPLPAPASGSEALIRPWRTAAYVAVGIAAFELLLLLAIGGGKLTGFVADQIEGAARQQALAQPNEQQAKPVTRKPAVATAAVKRSRSKTVVMVLNGNGRTGAAASAASRVQSRGYRVGAVTNAPRQVSRSIVMYRPGFAGEGRRLGKDIGVGLVTPLDGMRASALGGAHVVFILGP